MYGINMRQRRKAYRLFDSGFLATMLDKSRLSYAPVRELYGRMFSDVHVFSRSKGDHPFYNTHTGWNESIESGKSLMVGKDVPTTQFMKGFSRPMQPWQKAAFIWAKNNPDMILEVESNRYAWQVYVRGEYVEFVLPHHDKGGERAYISRTGKTMVLVNVD